MVLVVTGAEVTMLLRKNAFFGKLEPGSRVSKLFCRLWFFPIQQLRLRKPCRTLLETAVNVFFTTYAVAVVVGLTDACAEE